ncbi:hypothetical protein F4781DRAFT_438106 [Annulohypoxylon bovei var. microspora]|nr:hypothetical protein F4781DRAFT_438106 [Annulohypoxylon bovei var. microspora]
MSDGDVQPASEPTVSFQNGGIKPSIFDAYLHRGPVFRDMCLYDYASIVLTVPKPRGRWKDRHVLFEGDVGQGRFWPYGRTAVVRLALFIPWEEFLSRESGTPIEIWDALSQNLSLRLNFINGNFDLLRKSKDDAVLDRRNWDSQLHEDAPTGFDDPDDAEGFPDDDSNDEEDDRPRDVRDAEELKAFSRSVTECMNQTIMKGGAVFEPRVGHLLRAFQAGGASQLFDLPIAPELNYYHTLLNDFGASSITSSRDNTFIKKAIHDSISKWKADIVRFNKHIVQQIAGESDGNLDHDRTNFEDMDHDLMGMNEDPIILPSAETIAPSIPSSDRPTTLTIEYELGDTWEDLSKILAQEDNLNQKQAICLTVVLGHLDKIDMVRATDLDSGAMELDKSLSLFHYLGGEGGTGKSVVIRTLIKALSLKGFRRRICITATSGNAAAHIDGVTIHSAVNLLNQSQPISREKKQAWKNINILVVDECSIMSGKDL